jgi:hypothetical protein
MSILVIKDSDGTTVLLESGKLVSIVDATTERMGALRVTDHDWANIVTTHGPIVS